MIPPIDDDSEPVRLRRLSTDELTPGDVAAVRELLWAAFPPGDEGFSEDDWNHALGGVHFLLDVGDRVVGHASVVERQLEVGGRPLRTGYVEAVAVDPGSQGRGIGSLVMRDVTTFIRERFELGALGTGAHHFYQRLGWRTWRGPSGVRESGAVRPTPDDDGYILVLETPSSPALDLEAPISCEWRPGDAW